MTKTSSLIAIVPGGSSPINASLGLVRTLIERGHQVVYLALATHRAHVERQGLECHVLKFPDEKEVEDHAKSKLVRMFGRHCQTVNAYLRIECLEDRVERWIRTNKPDLILLDSNLLAIAPPIIKCSIPIINLNSTMSSWCSDGRPPVFSGLVPAQHPGIISRLRLRAAWTAIILAQYRAELLRWLLLRILTKMKTPAARLHMLGAEMRRTEYGLRLAAPEITLGPRCLDFPSSTGNERHYAGACVDDHRQDSEFSFEWLDREKILIYCGMGTSGARYNEASKLYRCLFEAMDELPDCQLLLQTRWSAEVLSKLQAPRNMVVFENVPQLEVLKRARLFITHGGFSSIREGVFCGIPMIVLPIQHDQPGNAARIAYYGLGTCVQPKRLNTKRLVSIVKSVLRNQQIGNAMLRMRSRVLEEDDRDAVFLIEETAHSRPVSVS